jgi:predicted ATPase
MKITRLEIKDYQQFKDFELDLTYPKGHSKAGQALDKVCFIGQSGTGKTTLLNIMKDYLSFLIIAKKDNNITERFIRVSNEIINQPDLINEVYKITINANNYIYTVSKNGNKIENFGFFSSDFGKFWDFLSHINILKKVIYIFFNAELLDKGGEFIKNSDISPHIYLDENENMLQTLENEKIKLIKPFFDFSTDNPVDIWRIILNNAHSYMKEEVKYSKALAKKILSSNSEEMDEIVKKAKEWRKNTTNPFAELAEKINPILNEFNLELKININFEDIEEMKFVSIHHKGTFSEKLNYHTWSTGTKQVIMSATPLFALDSSESVILFDEPERSLYPNIQKNLIKYYTGLAPEAQFFFATHSPLIASQFEPWEIVELKFDEDGRVYREKFYEGENHVDNYTIYPQYLRWDSILRKVFDLDTDRNSLGNEKLNELTALEVKLRKLKQKEGDNQTEILEVWEEYEKLADLLDWHINEKNR